MKKILFVLLLGSLVVPNLASAAVLSGPEDCCKMRRAVEIDGVTCIAGSFVGPSATATCSIGVPTCPLNNTWGLYCVINTLNTVVDWIFIVLMALAIILTIMGAMNIMMSQGDPGKVDAGRNYIMYAALGLIIAIIARAIPSLAKSILGR